MKKPSQVRSVHIGTRITTAQRTAIKKKLGKYQSMSDYLLNLIEWNLADSVVVPRNTVRFVDFAAEG